MKKWGVSIPIVAVCYVEVEAENEEEAIEKVFNSDDLNLDNVEEWNAFRHIVEGNCVHASNTDIHVEEIED